MLLGSRHPSARVGSAALRAVHDLARPLELPVVFLLQARQVAALAVPLGRALPLLALLAVLTRAPGLRGVPPPAAFGRLLRFGNLLLETREPFTRVAELVHLIGELLRLPSPLAPPASAPFILRATLSSASAS